MSFLQKLLRYCKIILERASLKEAISPPIISFWLLWLCSYFHIPIYKLPVPVGSSVQFQLKTEISIIISVRPTHPRVYKKNKSCSYNFSNYLIPFYNCRWAYQKKIEANRSILRGPTMQLKYWNTMEMSRKSEKFFVLAITFKLLLEFTNCFRVLSGFLLFFKKTPIKTIFDANSYYYRSAIMGIFVILAIF